MGAAHSVLLIREYMGTGLVMIWFFVSLIYLFLKEERKPVRILFVYVPTVLLFLFFNPFVAGLLYQYMGNEIYYRILWLIPVTVVVAYTAVTVVGRQKGKKRLALGIAVVFLSVVSGKYIYNNTYYEKADNLYHVPDSVVNICDAIEIPGREVMAVFPLELIQYVRQYSPVVCMPYGREILVESWNEWAIQSELCDAMEAEVVEAEKLGRLARQEACIYIILPDNKAIRGSLQAEGYGYFGETDGYVIYRDSR